MRRLVLVSLLLLLAGLLPQSEAKKRLPLSLGVEVEWERERTGRESRRLDLEELLRDEIEEEGCFRSVAEAEGESDLRLVVRLREFSMNQESGGVSRVDERSGEVLRGRVYECRIDLVFALLPPEEGEALHVDDFLVVNREQSTSNPLWDPRYQAERRASEMVVRELRKRVCRRGKKILEELERRESEATVSSR
jgi:hypothetical protein